MTNKRISGTVAVAGAAILLAAGCGASDDGASAPGAKSPSADPAKAPSLVLTKSDLPPGYQVMEIPRSKLDEVADSMLGSVKSATITPSTCDQVALLPAAFDFDKVGFLVAMKATSMLAETVLVADRSVDDVRRSVTGDCSETTVKITEGQAAGGRGTVVSTVIDVPDTTASDAVAIQQKATTVLNGTTVSTTKVLGFAEVNGYLVGVQAGDAGANGTPDLGAFNTTFTKAVDKVAAKMS